MISLRNEYVYLSYFISSLITFNRFLFVVDCQTIAMMRLITQKGSRDESLLYRKNNPQKRQESPGGGRLSSVERVSMRCLCSVIDDFNSLPCQFIYEICWWEVSPSGSNPIS
jgi:hypothetical protein